MTVVQLEQWVLKQTAIKAEKRRAIAELGSDLERVQNELEIGKKARTLIQKVAKDTQTKLQYHISNLVSNALATIFDDPYKFKLEFVEKRGRTEAMLLFEKDGDTFAPMYDSGGGVLDIASFALRLSFWGLGGASPTIILDEPSKHLSADKQDKYVDLLKALQSKLNVQFIIVTHIDRVKQAGNNVVEVLDGTII